MNVELTPEQVEFIERAIASGQYGTVKEVLSQVWAIGMKAVEQAIVRETELRRLQDIRDRDMARMQQEDDADLVEEQAAEFVKEMEKVRRRSEYLRNCFGELIK